MNRKYPHFAIPEIYGESLSYYELLRKLVKTMNVMIDNYNTIPDQIAEAVANLDASQLFTAVLAQLIDSIATDNTKSTNAVKVYKKYDLLYATFNETVNLYESLIDFTTGTETELIIGTNIREVNISELFIELRKMIDDEVNEREHADNLLQQSINTERSDREQSDNMLQQSINTERSDREQADNMLQQSINTERSDREQADNTKVNKTDVLTLEQIQSLEELTGMVTSASALKKFSTYFDYNYKSVDTISVSRDGCKLYFATPETIGVPISSEYFLVFSFTPINDENYGIQIAFSYTSNSMYMRRKWASWGAWKKIDN